MTHDITIPPEAVEAARRAFMEAMLSVPQPDPIVAALRAGIAAWPGMIVGNSLFDGEPMAFLPLPQEARDE